MPELEAVLFDMDGTLVDTEPYWITAEYELVEQWGGTWSQEHAHNLVGNAPSPRAPSTRLQSTVAYDLAPLELCYLDWLERAGH